MELITREVAGEMAEEMLYRYLTASYGQRLVSDHEKPLSPYIQEQNSYSMAGEVFSVPCPGIGNLDMTDLRAGWDCKHLSDKEVIATWCHEGDMSDSIKELAEAIYTSANEE
jgi:hypothetical protein